MRTRFAPTPSGFLHVGNVRNARETAALAEELGASLWLRIDDADASRYRTEYLDDIFRVLRILRIEWDHGPLDAADFEAHWSQRQRTERYRAALAASGLGRHTYACRCSRSEQSRRGSAGCVADCSAAGLPLVPHVTALRLRLPRDRRVAVGGRTVDLSSVPDPVLWRRDDLPAYHLASVLEDADNAVTHIVRGADLLESSAIQVHLARLLGLSNVANADYIHHPLVVGADGVKLSKSTLARPAPLTVEQITSA